MSIRVMSRVWDNSAAKGSALLVLLAIADFASDDGGNAYPSIPTLAKKVRMSERQVQRIVNTLADVGELVVIPGPTKTSSNSYQVVVDALGARPWGDILSPLKGDILSPGGDVAVSPGGDIAMSERGDIAMSPDPPVIRHRSTSEEIDLDSLWTSIRLALVDQLNPATVALYTEGLKPLSLQNGRLIVECPSTKIDQVRRSLRVTADRALAEIVKTNPPPECVFVTPRPVTK